MKTCMILSLLCLTATSLFAQATLVKDINPGVADGLSDYKDALIPFQGKLFFRADDGQHGEELWVSDGTEAGTYMLKDINPGANGSAPNHFTVFNGNLYFDANNGANGRELWVSDGTEAGTQLHYEFALGSQGVQFAFMSVTNNRLVLKTGPESGLFGFVWGSDPAAEQFYSLAGAENGIQPEIAASPDKLYFVDLNDNLRASDGTPAGTILMFDPVETFNTYNPLTVVGTDLYFGYGQSANGTEPWFSNGSQIGTYELHQFQPGGYQGGRPAFFSPYNGYVYFRANNKMWRSDGTVVGTEQFKNIDAFGGINDYDKDGLVYNGKLYFSGNDGSNGSELWVTDGTEAGTVMLKNLNTNFLDANPMLLTDGKDGFFYFTAYTNTSDYALWRSDGTANGTVKVADPYPGDNAERIWAIVPVGNNLFFVTPSANEGQELWKLPITMVSNQEVVHNLVTAVSPNPAADKLFLTCNFNGDADIQLLDQQGRTLQSWQRETAEGQTLELNLNNVPTGFYLLQLNHKGNVQVVKTVVRD